MDADAVHADTDRAGGVTQAPPGGVDASRLMVVLLDVVPVRDVGVTHVGSIRAPSVSPQRLSGRRPTTLRRCWWRRDRLGDIGARARVRRLRVAPAGARLGARGRGVRGR